MGRFSKSASGGLEEGSPRNQQTNIPGFYAIGECDYQYHGANRLGANSLLSCIFSGLFAAPGVLNSVASQPNRSAEEPARLFRSSVRRQEERHEALLARRGGKENPYALHQELGNLMTRTATVVRRNDQLAAAYDEVCQMEEPLATLFALGYRKLDQSKCRFYKVSWGYVSIGKTDTQRCAFAR